jgi:hypothetical protein
MAEIDKEIEASEKRIENAEDQLALDLDCVDGARDGEGLMECYRDITGRK